MHADFQLVADFLKRFWINLQPLVELVFGKINWHAPDWLQKIFRGIGWAGGKHLSLHDSANANPKKALTYGLITALLVTAISGGLWWKQHQPQL